MKLILILFIFTNFLFSNEIKTISANFKQIIKDDKNKELIYSGNIVFKKQGNKSVWFYNYPVKKSIYLNAGKVIIVEPEIEQVIIKDVSMKEFDYFKILKLKIHIKDNKYKIKINDIWYFIEMNKEVINKIKYIDEMENEVLITFDKVKKNDIYIDDYFIPIISKDFDIINSN